MHFKFKDLQKACQFYIKEQAFFLLDLIRRTIISSTILDKENAVNFEIQTNDFNIYEHDKFCARLGWTLEGFYNLRPCLGQQKYSLPKIKIMIGHPKTSSKQTFMCLARPPEKRAHLIHVLWVLKRTVSLEK